MSYSGLPTTESLSPYRGMTEVLRKQMAGGNGTLDFKSLVAHVAISIGDYDAYKQRPVAGPYHKREQGEEVPPEAILTRLEDIDESWLENYVRSGIIGYKIRGDGRSKQMKDFKEAISFQNSDGEYLTDADLMSDRDNTTDLHILEAKAKLPYLLKRVHFKSKQLGVSLISMFGVYLKIGGNASTPPRDMLRGHTIWRMNNLGFITSPYPETANQNPGFGDNLRYIKGLAKDEFYYDLLEFRDTLDVLGIKLWEEDPREFDEKFMSNLVVKYVMSNNEFLWKGQKRDASVLSALGSASVNDWGAVATVSDTSRVLSFVSTFTESNSDDLQNYMREDHSSKVDYFIALYAQVSKDPNFGKDEVGRLFPQSKDMLTYSGFFCMPDDNAPYAFDVSFIHTNAGARALLHRSGHVVLISRNNKVSCLTAEEAAAALLTYTRSKGVGGKATWKTLVM